MKQLNKEELLVGFIYGSCCWPLISWLAVIPGVICSLLWAIGGSGPKLVRRLGVPLVMAVILSFTNLWLLFTVLPLWGIVAIGYGMPNNKNGDEGSTLGRFYLKFLSYKAANWATRFTIYGLFNIIIIAALAITKS
jgi:hypothetical protein